ncbi:low molecular weight phosphatase family protein [Terrabacter sp. MAHUQ-38]|uniref:arsenate reductase/protein-tyrosine-phosphatase family protein n=1 Tax=unclassified Terrabacter TaxID=2630222 RepID=UPI00165DFE5D|nr:low molecular weight phosphatase family protein [Terrabacter sp. MAHUQ-38]
MTTALAGRVLVVCTGNVCRSPYIERRLVQLLAGTGVEVASAGTRALVGAPIEPGSVDALGEVHADAAGFAARQITPALIRDADLVVTATQRHRHEVVALLPRALRRTFSLGELADLLRDADLGVEMAALEAHDPTGPAASDASWAARLAALAWSRRGRSTIRQPEESDIPDPYGRGSAAYALMSHEIEAQIGVVAEALRPRTP